MDGQPISGWDSDSARGARGSFSCFAEKEQRPQHLRPSQRNALQKLLWNKKCLIFLLIFFPLLGIILGSVLGSLASESERVYGEEALDATPELLVDTASRLAVLKTRDESNFSKIIIVFQDTQGNLVITEQSQARNDTYEAREVMQGALPRPAASTPLYIMSFDTTGAIYIFYLDENNKICYLATREDPKDKPHWTGGSLTTTSDNYQSEHLVADQKRLSVTSIAQHKANPKIGVLYQDGSGTDDQFILLTGSDPKDPNTWTPTMWYPGGETHNMKMQDNSTDILVFPCGKETKADELALRVLWDASAEDGTSTFSTADCSLELEFGGACEHVPNHWEDNANRQELLAATKPLAYLLVSASNNDITNEFLTNYIILIRDGRGKIIELYWDGQGVNSIKPFQAFGMPPGSQNASFSSTATTQDGLALFAVSSGQIMRFERNTNWWLTDSLLSDTVASWKYIETINVTASRRTQ